MRRVLSLFSVLVILLVLSACAAEVSDTAPEEAIVGKWKYSLNENIREALTKVLDDERAYIDVFYEFNSDKTGCSYSSVGDKISDKMDFTYEIDGEALSMKTEQGAFTVSCSIKGDSMTIVEDGETVIFKKLEN